MAATHARKRLHEAPLWRAYSRHRYAILFYVLLTMLVALPVFDTLGLPSVAIKLLMAVCLVAAVMPNASKSQRTIFLTAILLIIGLRFLAEPDEVPINF